MRLIGRCPACNAEDSILTHDNISNIEGWRRATCGQCGQSWSDWFDLSSKEGRIGNQLTPVLVKVGPRSAELAFPASFSLPYARLIVSVLNVALIVCFKLRVCFATEGGVAGRVQGESIELHNSYDTIGLWDDYGFDENPVCQKILKWYAETLRTLFEEELVVGDKNYGRGTILKLSPEDPLREEKTKSLLWLALCKKTGSQGFARAVFERMEIELALPLSGPYIAGLTD